MTTTPPEPNWYDVLDVDPTATTDEVDRAWREAIADLTPADRRFRLYNRAAEVLLDPQRRAGYDATLVARDEPGPVAGSPDAAAGDATAAGGSTRAAVPAVVAEKLGRLRSRRSAAATAPEPAEPREAAAGRLPVVPGWLVAVVAILAALSVGVTAYLWTQPSEGAVAAATGSARSAAERAVVPLLSYDYRTLEQDKEAAYDVMTSDYRTDKYDPLFELIEQYAPRTRTVVDVEVLASAVVRAGEDRAEILVFINRPTTNKTHREPLVYKDQATLTMERSGDEWLVDDVTTSPIAP